MKPLTDEDLIVSLDLLESITYGKIEENIIYDLYGVPLFNIVKNEFGERKIEFVEGDKNPRLDKYKQAFEKIIGKIKEIK